MIQAPESITMANAAQVATQWRAALPASTRSAAGAVQIDCAALRQFDSAALSCILNLLRQPSLGAAPRVELLNVPENLRKLANLYGISAALS
jgi:phospholipid transport system transporter-binding protein